MNFRIFISFNLILLALIILFLPTNESKGDELKPSQLLEICTKNTKSISVDLAARYLNENDSSVQFIDLRTPLEFSNHNIPGSINIPLDSLLKKDWQGYLNQHEKSNILYSSNDFESNLALAILSGKGYKNNAVLKGGLNEWGAIIMNSDFKGGRLTARENALYENRRNAKTLFTQINSLPDSLKNTFLEAKILEEEQLDGGCE